MLNWHHWERTSDTGLQMFVESCQLIDQIECPPETNVEVIELPYDVGDTVHRLLVHSSHICTQFTYAVY